MNEDDARAFLQGVRDLGHPELRTIVLADGREFTIDDIDDPVFVDAYADLEWWERAVTARQRMD